MNNFPIENYRPSRPLGQGAYGTVLLYERQNPNDDLLAKVAVKVFQSREVASRCRISSDQMKEFASLQEIQK